jgi:hypothetical protein
MAQTKEEKNEYNKAYSLANKEKRKTYRLANKEKIKETTKTYYLANNEKIKEYAKAYRLANKEYKKDYDLANKEKIKEYQNDYSLGNKENKHAYYLANKEKINFRVTKRRKTDPIYRLRCTLGTRTRSAFKMSGWNKNGRTEKLLGISYEKAKQHLERQFTKGMTWDNYGEWQIDHIYPLAKATTEEELIRLCHYTNLQPLWALDNLKKGAKIPTVQMQLRI